jgi:uncharacterized protein YdaT
MDWTFENFKADLNDLTPEVREKALRIAKDLMKKEGISDNEAMRRAIVQAQEWLYDSEG